MKEGAGAKTNAATSRFLMFGCQVEGEQQITKRPPSPLMRESCVAAAMSACRSVVAGPSLTMPVLQLLSDSGSVITQVSRRRLSACVCLQTPIDYSCSTDRKKYTYFTVTT